MKFPVVISKYFETEGEANEYYLTLCERYESVKLVRAPWDGCGAYIWECK